MKKAAIAVDIDLALVANVGVMAGQANAHGHKNAAPREIQRTRIMKIILRQANLLLVVILSMLIMASPSMARTVGMIADNGYQSVIVFDADTDTVLGSILLANHGLIGDVSITSDQTTGFVTDFLNHVWIIDLTTSPPSLASGTNPIGISTQGEDISISPDGKHLLVCDVQSPPDLSVINILAREQVSAFNLGSDCNSVDICVDGSVLVTSASTGNVRRLPIDGTGTITDTSEVLYSGGTGFEAGPNNVFCAPNGKSAVVLRREPREIRSFTIPNLALVSTRSMTGTEFSGISGLVNTRGGRVFTRSNGGAIDVFSYNSTTAVLSDTPLFSIPISSTITFYGMDQMALAPSGTKLYVSQPGAVKVYAANTGDYLSSITNHSIVTPTGIGFAKPRGHKYRFPRDVK